jgi:hypothetical protein
MAQQCVGQELGFPCILSSVDQCSPGGKHIIVQEWPSTSVDFIQLALMCINHHPDRGRVSGILKLLQNMDPGYFLGLTGNPSEFERCHGPKSGNQCITIDVPSASNSDATDKRKPSNSKTPVESQPRRPSKLSRAWSG